MLFPFSSVLCAAPVRPKEENWGVGGNSCQKTSSSSSSWFRKTSTLTSTTAAQKTAMYARTHAPTQTGSFPPVSLINFKKISLQISASLFCALSLHAERLPNAPGGTRRRSSSSFSSSYDLAAMVAAAVAATAADNNKNKSKRPKREQKKFSRGAQGYDVFSQVFLFIKRRRRRRRRLRQLRRRISTLTFSPVGPRWARYARALKNSFSPSLLQSSFLLWNLVIRSRSLSLPFPLSSMSTSLSLFLFSLGWRILYRHYTRSLSVFIMHTHRHDRKTF